jgi:NADPH:quinone reductase-like Zn-dependent oxidoreductase
LTLAETNGDSAMKAVRFSEYGDVDVLNVEDVPDLVAGPGQVVVQVKAAGINPGEAKIRSGLLHSRWPATFPSGEGSDLAGVIAQLGPGVTGLAVGEDVIGFTDNRSSHAEYALVEARRSAVGRGRSAVRGRRHGIRRGPRGGACAG